MMNRRPSAEPAQRLAQCHGPVSLTLAGAANLDPDRVACDLVEPDPAEFGAVFLANDEQQSGWFPFARRIRSGKIELSPLSRRRWLYVDADRLAL
jgi:hypothetical protein